MSAVMPRVLVMAGGTGGHVYPALAVAHGLRALGWKVDWVGTERGLENRVVPAQGFTLHRLSVQGLRGKGLLFRLISVFHLLRSLVDALLLVRRIQPQVVLGMGGYAAGPAGVAAVLLRKPLVIHEQNAVAGTTNHWLAPVARAVLCGFDGAFPGRPDAVVLGNPVRSELAACHKSRRRLPEVFDKQRPLRLLVLGGSLGSLPLNQGVPAALATLDPEYLERVTVRHQCGEQHVAATLEAYQSVQAKVSGIEPFIADMAVAYNQADLVICRAGALTVSELAITSTPAILIPLPHAIDDHQTGNAQTLSRHGAAALLPQREMTPALLGRQLTDFIAHPERLQAMSDAAHACAAPDATAAVIAVLEEVANES